MIEALKKKSFKNSLIGSIILIIIGISMGTYFLSDALSAVTGYVTFEDLEPDEIKSQQVEIDVTANFGCYMEEYSENTTTHIRTTTDLYYVIWTGDENATDFRYMTIKVPAKYEKQMEEIAENTYNEVYSEPLHFVGKIHKLSSKEYEYFEEYFTESGWSAADIEDMTLPYYIDVTGTTATAGTTYGIYIIFVALGLVLLIVGIYRIVKGAKGGYMKKFTKSYENAGYTESGIESDLASAVSFNKKGTIKIGRLCTYYELNSTEPKLIPNKNIVWAYQNTTTHRTNGIKTGVTYSVMVYEDGKKVSTISVPNEATAQDMLKKMNEMLPWVVVGYSEELKKLFNKDRAQFLELRYNKVEHVAVEPGFESYNSQGQ